MSWSKSKSEKCCLTCANWGGPRSIKGFWAETDKPDTRGKCYAGVSCGVTQGPCAMQGGSSCSKYQTWPALK